MKLKRTVFANEQVIACDIDDTLIQWDLTKPGRKIEILCAYGVQMETPHHVVIHEPHVRLIKERLQRGALIVAWSAGGFAWANAVLTALQIDHPNLIVLSKPIAYLDDKECQHWMGDRVYLPPDSHWRPKGT
jgi:hypothetical protein